MSAETVDKNDGGCADDGATRFRGVEHDPTENERCDACVDADGTAAYCLIARHADPENERCALTTDPRRDPDYCRWIRCWPIHRIEWRFGKS